MKEKYVMKLKPIPSTELSSYVVDLLAARAITTVREFLAASLDDLAKITNLSRDAVMLLRAKILKKYCPKRINALGLYNELKFHRKVYGFDIESCDRILKDHKFCSGSIFEIYGTAGIGKTQLCLTITANVVSNWNAEALYIDTKNDFSGKRLMEMLRARNINNSQSGHIMQRIKLERTMSLKGILKILNQLYTQLQTNSSDVAGIKLVVIDAVPAVWFVHNSDEERFERKSVLCQIVELVRLLAQERLLAFLFVNLAVESEELLTNNAERQNLADNEIDTCSSSTSRRSSIADDGLNGMPLKPTLGRYWIAIPQIRLLLKMPEGAEENSTERVVEVTRNCFGPVGTSCRVYVTDEGVVS